MNRLTKKSNSTLKAIEYQLIDEKENLDANEGIKKIPVLATNKLGVLEDIEEELGIDLITLFKALKDGINVYYEDEERYKFHNNLRLEYHKTLGWGLVYIYGCNCRDDMSMKLDKEFYELKDYGKTWALTKEELESETIL